MTPPPQTYYGPTALTHSKYASPHLKKAQLVVPPAVSSVGIAPANNTIATKEQIAATQNDSMTLRSSDAELAATQGLALKAEVEQHAAKLSSTVSTTMSNTRRLLELIREAVQKDNPSALQDVDHLWAELEQLFEAAKGAKDAVTDFLGKQRNNMALYHASVMNETYRESQEELNIQYKKVNLQHGLILEHQQAFQDYREQMNAKLKDLDDIKEKASRLTLEKGNFRSEVDRYKQLLEEEQATRFEDQKKADALQKELDELMTSNKQLLADTEGFKKTVNDLQEKMKAGEQATTDRYTAELKETSDLLAKETAKTAYLTTMVNNLKDLENRTRMEVEKVKAENKLTQEKFNRMAAEHSQTFSRTKEQTKKLEDLTAEADRLRKESTDLKQRLAKLPELEKNNAALFTEKANLLEQVGELKTELDKVKESCVKVNKEFASLNETLQDFQKERDDLKSRNKDLKSKQSKFVDVSNAGAQSTETATFLQVENKEFLEAVEKLKGNQAAPAVGAVAAVGQVQAGLQASIRGLEKEKVALQAALEEWTTLAKRSYKEYKDMLPTYKQADLWRTQALAKDEQIEELNRALTAARVSRSNDVGSGGDAAHWKKRYDDLLAKIGG
ncbi:hypothetical protein EK21DRAFT_101677 [Setomelanomma holmii]|uniref:Uncharacterized protein n=1 Tax=Setomelanomma holmii TaxID=210430 RepID=A0A9P4H7J0_9PLEO|nr:hypothetical protein EK21DRAFT_101677 [Setomelanomma holmii]